MTDFLTFAIVVGIIAFAIYNMAADDHPLKKAMVAALGGAAALWPQIVEFAKGLF